MLCCAVSCTAENSASLADALRAVMAARREQDNFQLIVITHDEHFAHLIGGCGLRVHRICTARIVPPSRVRIVPPSRVHAVPPSRVRAVGDATDYAVWKRSADTGLAAPSGALIRHCMIPGCLPRAGVMLC